MSIGEMERFIWTIVAILATCVVGAALALTYAVLRESFARRQPQPATSRVYVINARTGELEYLDDFPEVTR